MIEDTPTGIFYKKWIADSPKAIFLLVHGLGAHSGRWEYLADFFVARGISSYAIELRGFGETTGLRGHIDSFSTYIEDITRLSEIISVDNKDKKIFLIGESTGALLSFLTASSTGHLFDGMACLSPAFSGRLKVTFLDYVKILLPFLYNPKKQHKIAFNSGMCTRDVDYRIRMEEDDREHRLATSRFIWELLKAQIYSSRAGMKIKIPVLFLLAGDDFVVSSLKSKEIFNDISVEDKKLIEYPGMYHALSIEIGREDVFFDIYKWVINRMS